jgi:hypothetical protein
MKENLVRLVGTVPIMMHNNQTVSPLNRYTQAIKPLTGKRKKTDEDTIEIARMEWEAGLYLNDGFVVVPGRCIDASFREGAKRSKEGRKWVQGAMVMDDYCVLDYKGKKNGKFKLNGDIPCDELDELFKTNSNMEPVKVGTSTILRTRPIFYDWSLECTVAFDEKIFDERAIVNIIQETGKYVGLIERRPRYGKFTVEI